MLGLVGALLLAALRCDAALVLPAGSFRVSLPPQQTSLLFSSAATPRFGRLPPLRLIYYVLRDDAFNDEDRDAIKRQVLSIQEFYGHHGLEIPTEGHVYEVRARADGPQAGDYRDFFEIQEVLESKGLYAPGRTVVFAAFDTGFGSSDGMALTVINSQRVSLRECPAGQGKAWWCGRPLAAHRGGSVHEVGHLLGLAHPEFRYQKILTVMGDHWRLGNDPRTGLLPTEIEHLRRRYTMSVR